MDDILKAKGNIGRKRIFDAWQFMAVEKRVKILRDKKKGEIRRKIEIKAIGGSTSVSPHHSTQSSSGK